MSERIASLEFKVEKHASMTVAGLAERYTGSTAKNIPLLWQRFGPFIGSIPGQTGKCAYGVKRGWDDRDNSFEYISGWEVKPGAQHMPDFTYVDIPAQTYLVFTHRGQASTIRNTCDIIWEEFFPQSKYEPSQGPEFELYDERFDPETNSGITELWIPIKA